MNFFDDDSFEDIVNEFFRGSRAMPQKSIQNEQEERIIDFIETEKKIFVIFELSGYSEEDVELIVNKKYIEIIVRKKNFENIQDYLIKKLKKEVLIKKSLPDLVKIKNFKHTFKNGVLEIMFNKK